MSDAYAVLGNPISHSLSPLIHQYFAKQTKQDIIYQKKLVDVSQLKKSIKNFFAQGGRGCNISLPFKIEAFDVVDKVSDRAKKAGAINTIVLKKNHILFGDNTDGIGLLNDLTLNHQIIIKNKKILLLGAGGSVRGIIPALIDEHPELIHIANRTHQKAAKLAEAYPSNVFASGFEYIPEEKFDLVINATSSSLTNNVPDIPSNILLKDSVSYDLVYRKQPTAFQLWSLNAGVSKALEGLGMLVEQAAEAFLLWRGIKPNTCEVIEYLKGK